MQAEVGSGSQSDALGDLVDRELHGFQERSGSVDSSAEDPLQRRVAGLLEAAHEGAQRHPRVRREIGDSEWFVKARQRPFSGRRERIAMRCRAASGKVLSLAAAPIGRRHQTAGDVVRDAHAEVAPDDVKAQVDARRGTG